ncbi:hypothetical protein FRC09_001186 [Ceratobasidium sp. 395]|nr:hypothetical protein FRC09_001186 [Ceratobasidium sp. 395]
MSVCILARTGRSLYALNHLRATCRYASSSATSPNSSSSPAPSPKTPTSSCPPQTVLTGLNWRKGQPPVLALEDSEYPPWLWTVLDEKKPGDGTSKQEMRKKNRQKIRLQNFMKKQ